MCGVFGFISKDGQGPNMKRLANIAKVTERRGPHAFGFAWIDGRGRLRMFKQTGRISDHLGLLAMAADARLLIGHCRYATQGDPGNNLNNHPHAADGGWVVHNGTIPNYRELVEAHELWPVTDCDTEVLGLLVEQLPGTLAQRCAGAVELVEDRPAVLMGLWAKPARLVVVRSGNPLQIGTAATGTYLASLPTGMPRNTRPMRDGSTLEFNLNGKGESHVKDATQRQPQARPATVRTGSNDGVRAISGNAEPAGRFAIKSRRAYGF